MNRRQFLAGAAGAAVAARPRRRRRVIVIGAGLAGLAAAYELERAGFEVIVLEARDRIGGRVLTIRTSFVQGQHSEAGGEYVDASHATLLGYAQRFGLALEDVRGHGRNLEDLVYLNDRRRLRGQVVRGRARAEVDRFWRRVDALAAPLDPADPVARGAALDERSAADLLDELDLHPLARLLVEHELRDEFTVEPETLSLLYLAQDAKLNAGLADAGVERYRLRDGNDALPRALASPLRDVRGRSPVERIHGAETTITVNDLGADFCVAAIPMTAFRAIELLPRLPDPLTDAVWELRYGAATKTSLQYPRRFWRQEGLSGDILTDLTFGSSWEATDGQRGTAGILLAYTAGRNAYAYGDVDAPHRILLAADELDDIFPGTRDRVLRGSTTAWHAERYTRGSYTAYAPGQVTKFWRALRQPIGRLYLAGEHADAYTGTMEGALRSGRRVAAAIRTAAR